MLKLKSVPVDMASSDHHQPTIYVVDDEDHLLQSLSWLLSEHHFLLKTFASSQEFLEYIQPEHAGCLVLDHRMPGLGGLDVQARLLERGIRLPVIMLTGYGDINTAVRAMKNKAVDFLEKPVEDQTLLNCIRQALELDARYRADQLRQREAERRVKSLSPREREVARRVVQGMSSKEAASEMEVSHKTVEAHRASIMKKLNVANSAQLICLWLNYHQGSNNAE